MHINDASYGNGVLFINFKGEWKISILFFKLLKENIKGNCLIDVTAAEQIGSENLKKDEKALVRSAIRGNTESYAVLVTENKEYFYRTAFTYAKEEQMALDILSDSIIKGYKAIKSLKEERYFTTWMCRIIINTAKDYLKSNPETVDIQDIYYLSDESGVDTELKMDLQKALNELPDNYRQAIELMYYEGYKTKDIAKKMEVPENTVSTYIRRGKIIMKKSLGKDYIEEGLLWKTN